MVAGTKCRVDSFVTSSWWVDMGQGQCGLVRFGTPLSLSGPGLYTPGAGWGAAGTNGWGAQGYVWLVMALVSAIPRW